MEYPSEDVRRQLEEMRYDTEEDCARNLAHLAELIGKQPNISPESDPFESLTAIEGWASLASYVVARTYAPQSPFRYPGWTHHVGRLLRRIATQLRSELLKIAQFLGATGCSVGVSFPWGLSVSLDWTV
ncbi:hypothetical protein [Streptomyces sp. NPDC001594]|uniref:hypothetical protein n=1 Tax=Streptomyces sp. NPDC001594 TaxID=3364590 RepID=UPI0036BF5D5A